MGKLWHMGSYKLWIICDEVSMYQKSQGQLQDHIPLITQTRAPHFVSQLI